jgi:hypothetical protein
MSPAAVSTLADYEDSHRTVRYIVPLDVRHCRERLGTSGLEMLGGSIEHALDTAVCLWQWIAFGDFEEARNNLSEWVKDSSELEWDEDSHEHRLDHCLGALVEINELLRPAMLSALDPRSQIAGSYWVGSAIDFVVDPDSVAIKIFYEKP